MSAESESAFVELLEGARSGWRWSCEHASARLPPWLEASEEDRPWMSTHWAVDLGAAAFTRELLRSLGGTAVLGGISRLVCDLNRGTEDPTWIVETVEGQPLSFNQGLSREERQRRRLMIYEPFHQTLSAQVEQAESRFLVSVHSFTPDYCGQKRELEVGVLCQDWDAPAEQLTKMLVECGWDARLNQPYSGKKGLMYSATRHARASGRPCLELELRQDLLQESTKAAALLRDMSSGLAELL